MNLIELAPRRFGRIVSPHPGRRRLVRPCGGGSGAPDPRWRRDSAAGASIVKLGSQVRAGRTIVAWLTMTLLLAPVIHCTIPTGLSRPGPAHGVARHIEDSGSAGSHQDLYSPDDDCVPHSTHCVLRSALPGANVHLLVHLLLILSMAACALGGVFFWSASAVRGPPALPPTGPAGRGLLTVLCVSRR